MSPTDDVLRSIAVGAVGVALEAADASCHDLKRSRYVENAVYEYLVGALKRRGLTIVSEVKA